jgi:hypothetical protein
MRDSNRARGANGNALEAKRQLALCTGGDVCLRAKIARTWCTASNRGFVTLCAAFHLRRSVEVYRPVGLFLSIGSCAYVALTSHLPTLLLVPYLA